MIGPDSVMSMVARAKQAADLHTSTFAQQLLANVVSKPGWLDAQKQRILPMYRQRCHALADAFDSVLGDRLSFHRPHGGMFLWATFRDVHDTKALLARALDNGVAFVPGGAFTIDQLPNANARFSYSTLSPEQLFDAAQRVARSIDS